MDARDNENQKLHIRTLHILSQAGVCAWVWDSGVLQLRATDNITISPLLPLTPQVLRTFFF